MPEAVDYIATPSLIATLALLFVKSVIYFAIHAHMHTRTIQHLAPA